MHSRTKRLTGIATAVLALSAAVPAASASALAVVPCRAVAQSTGSEVAIVLAGHYVDSEGGDVTLTCHIIQNGVRVVSVRDPLIGPVAATVSDQRLGTAPFRVCYTVSIEGLSPWNYKAYSDC